MDEQCGQLLGQIISTIGTPLFAEATSCAICEFSDFELSSVVLHRAGLAPQLMFENLASVGCELGVENYIQVTHRANPILRDKGEGIFRARDFRLEHQEFRTDLGGYLVDAPEEELGFRTIGWPPRLEEVGLYFAACCGVVELSLYRERSRWSARARTLQILDALRVPLAVAFDRQMMLSHSAEDMRGAKLSALSARELQVAKLLLAGCSSEAVALRLGIARYTVKDHRKAIFRKLQISSLAELFALVSANA